MNAKQTGGVIRGTSAVLICACGTERVVASGFTAQLFDDRKFEACADRLGWRWKPIACPECLEEERKHE